MVHKIIPTKDYLLIVDNSEIKKGEFPKFTYLKMDEFAEILTHHEPIRENGYLGKKIISHLPINNSQILEGVDLLPPLEDDVEKLADEIYPETYYSGLYVDGWLKAGFIKGYNKAKEKYKYTEEDMIKAIEMAQEESWDEEGYLGLEYKPKQIIQSLQQQKMPVGFECEEVIYSVENDTPLKEIKTTTNSQGLSQWVGKYV